MPRRSFRDPVTGLLIAHGFMAQNGPGEIAQAEAEDFAHEPGTVRWDGTQWGAVPPPPRRRPRPFADLHADILALPAGDRQTLFVAMAAAFVSKHPDLARRVGLGFDGDEPDP
jgi:hypothetical protein